MGALAPTVQTFFTQRLINERNASPHTIAVYRETIGLLLRFAAARCEREPAMLGIADLDADTIAAFLDHLQNDRGSRAPHPEHQARGDPLALPGTPRSDIPSTPRTSSASSRSRRSAPTARS